MDKKLKRLSEYQDWIKGYSVTYKLLNYGAEVAFTDKAAELLNDRYWEYAENFIRPIISETLIEKGGTSKHAIDVHDESFISRFKIASTAELTIVDVQPIVKQGDRKKEKEENAKFAWFVAYSILIDFSEETISDKTLQFLKNYKENIPGIDTEKITTIYEEHIEWLSTLDEDVQLPIISNAQTWRLFYFSLLALEGKIKSG